MSFGFKYGLPPDADMVADMRFLPNPFWNEDLRALNGEDEAVRDYVLAQEGAAEFIDAYAASLTPVIAGYQRENKRHSTVAIGCTGGKHRSVATSIELAEQAASDPRARRAREASRSGTRVGAASAVGWAFASLGCASCPDARTTCLSRNAFPRAEGVPWH